MHPPWCVSRVFFHEGQKKGELEMAGREGKWWKGEEREIRGRGTVCPSRWFSSSRKYCKRTGSKERGEKGEQGWPHCLSSSSFCTVDTRTSFRDYTTNTTQPSQTTSKLELTKGLVLLHTPASPHWEKVSTRRRRDCIREVVSRCLEF